MDTKIGIYICKGCDIGKSLDCDKLVEENASKVAVCKTHDILCTPEGVKLINDDIEAEGLNRVVVAACSARVFPDMFQFGGNVLTDRVPIREYVTYTHEPNDEDTQTMAEDYIAMGIARVENSEVPEPIQEETSKDILVVGGGMTGMTAASAAADAGYKVHLIEKETELGGWANKFTKGFPKQPPYDQSVAIGCEELTKSVTSNENITVHTSTTIEKTSGQPGQFDVTMNNGSQETHRVGAIILANK